MERVLFKTCFRLGAPSHVETPQVCEWWTRRGAESWGRWRTGLLNEQSPVLAGLARRMGGCFELFGCNVLCVYMYIYIYIHKHE